MGQTLYLEIGTEEIPASYIVPALESMSVRMCRFLDENRIARGEPIVTGTPRRLVLNVAECGAFAAACDNGGHRAAQERRIRCCRKAYQGCRRVCERAGRKGRRHYDKADAQR